MAFQKWVTTAGSLSNLQLQLFEGIPDQIQEHETAVLVSVKCSGINFADIFACLGLYSATPKKEFTPGLEFSGTVEKIYEIEDVVQHSFKEVSYIPIKQ